MPEDILEDVSDDLDDGGMEDILDDALENTSKKKGPVKIKGFFKNIFGSKKAIIITSASLVLSIGLVLGGWFFFLKGSAEDDQAGQNTMATAEELKKTSAREEAVVFEDIVDLEPFERIQLKAGSTMALISISLSLELIDHRFRKQVVTMEDRIRKIITGQVEEGTWLELRNPEGKIMLKYNLLKRINSIFPKATVRNIYFTTFIMQRSNYE